MAEDINVLLDQCDQRVQVLSQEADRAKEEVSQIIQFTTTLAQTLTAASSEAQTSFEALTSKLEAAEQNLESELQSAKKGLSGLQEKVDQLQSQTEEKLGQIKSQLGELQSRKEQMLCEVNQESETTLQRFEKLSRQAQEVEDEVGNHQETAQGNIDEFRGAVDEATSSFSDRKASVIEQFEAFEEDFRNRLQSLSRDFSTVAQEGNSKLAAVQSSLDTTSGDAIAGMGQKFVEEAVGEFYDSADKLIESLSTLREAGEESNDLLDEKLAVIVDKIVSVFEVIDEVEPVLNEVKSTLG